MLLVGGVGGVETIGSPRTNRNPLTHQPTPTYLPITTRPPYEVPALTRIA